MTVRYLVEDVDDHFDGCAGRVDILLVRLTTQAEYEAAGVWSSKNDDGTWSCACASCQGPLSGMLATCVHARAAKRALIAGTVVKRVVPS